MQIQDTGAVDNSSGNLHSLVGLCVKTLIKMFRSWQFGSWTWKAIHGLFLSNPKWKDVCVNKWQLNTRWCVNKALVAFVLWLVFRILLASFFFTACLWMFIGSWILELNCWSSASTVRVFFSAWNFTSNLTTLPELMFSWYAIASQFDILPLLFLWDVKSCVHKSFDLNIYVKLKKTLETSKSFENNIQSCAIQSTFETSHNFSSQ